MGDAFSCALVCDMCVKRVKWYGREVDFVVKCVRVFVQCECSQERDRAVSTPRDGECASGGIVWLRTKVFKRCTRHITDTDTLNCMAMELHHSPSPDDQMTLF